MEDDYNTTFEWWEIKATKFGWKVSIKRSQIDHLQRRVTVDHLTQTFKHPFSHKLTVQQVLHLAHLEWNIAVPEVGELRRDPSNPTKGPLTTRARKVTPS